jgi:hypothetical protein
VLAVIVILVVVAAIAGGGGAVLGPIQNRAELDGTRTRPGGWRARMVAYRPLVRRELAAERRY